MRTLPSWLMAAFLAVPTFAQVDLTLIDTEPRGARLFSTGQVTVLYAVAGAPGAVQVDFFRDDGQGRVTVALPDPTNPPPPFRVVLPLKTNVDRASNSFQAVARDLVGNVIDLAGPLSVVSDDVGPDVPELLSPAFPAVVTGGSLRVAGTVTNSAGGGAVLPETAGRVEIRRASDEALLGGAVILPDARFQALVNLTSLTPGQTLDLRIRAIDEAGNPGQARMVQVTCPVASAPQVVATLEPPAGTITANPGVTLAGTVTGGPGPLAVHFFVNGRLSSQVTGLGNGAAFRHTLSLPGEGSHTLGVQATASGGLANPGLATSLGSLTLRR